MLIEDLEHLIQVLYATIQVSADARKCLAGMLRTEFDRLVASVTKELAPLTTDRERLVDARGKLLQAHYVCALPLDLNENERDRISAQLEAITNRPAAHHDEYAASARANLDGSLGLLTHIYWRCDNANHRLCNRAFFTVISIDEDGKPQFAYQRP